MALSETTPVQFMGDWMQVSMPDVGSVWHVDVNRQPLEVEGRGGSLLLCQSATLPACAHWRRRRPEKWGVLVGSSANGVEAAVVQIHDPTRENLTAVASQERRC